MKVSDGVLRRALGGVVVTTALVLSGLAAPTTTSAATSMSAVTTSTAVSSAGGFVSVSPARVMDTRSGLGGGVFGPKTQRKLKVTGGAVPAGVSAVVMNVTVTQPTHPGFVTVWAAGAARPTASNLNFTAGQTIPNVVVAPVDPSTGEVMFYAHSAGNVHLIADVSGYFVPGSATAAGTYQAIVPTRVMDTRSGMGAVTFGTNSTRDLQVTPTVPEGVSAVVMNVTVTGPKSNGFVTVWAEGSPKPTASSLNFSTGQTIPNLVVAPVNPSTGKVSFYAQTTGVDLLADVAGYFLAGEATTAGAYQAVEPTRLMDTRSSQGAERFEPGHTTQQLQVTGAVVPADVTATVMNVTVTQPEKPGFVTVWAEGVARPTASNLNYVAGQTIPNAVFGGVSGTTGKTSFYSSAPSHLLADVAGYFLPADLSPPPPPPPPVPGNTITGVLDAVDGDVTAVNVFVFPDSGESDRRTIEIADDGTYSIQDLAAGSYRVCFDRASGMSTTGYQGECVADEKWERTKAVPGTAATFTVTDSEGAGGADATFEKAGGVHGTVTGTDGSPLEGVEAVVFADGVDLFPVQTDADGGYSIGYLPPGTADVCFRAGGIEATPETGYGPECHDDVSWAGGDAPAAGSTPVTTTAGVSTPVSAQLGAGGAITGMVTDEGGLPISSADVVVYTPTGSYIAWGYTDETGAYEVTGLGTASYVVCFEASWGGESQPSGYLPECHDDVLRTGSWDELPEGTTTVPVTVGSTTSGIDAVLAPRPTGTIAGTVTDAEGPAQGVEVSISNATGDQVAWEYTDELGQYSVPGVTAGEDYQVCFDGRGASTASAPLGYAPECHDDVAWDPDTESVPSGAAPVAVAESTTTTVSAVLAPLAYGTITGTVKDGAGNGLGTEVLAIDEDGLVYSAWSETGTFSLHAPAGTYALCVDGSWAEGGTSTTGYLSECWQDQPWSGDWNVPPSGATLVTLTDGQTKSGHHVVLAPGGAVKGTVTDSAGPVMWAEVIAYRDGQQVGWSSTDESGNYSLVGLRTGSYVVCFEGSWAEGSSSSGYTSECYDNQTWAGWDEPVPSTTTPVSVTQGSATTGVDAVLAPL